LKERYGRKDRVPTSLDLSIRELERIKPRKGVDVGNLDPTPKSDLEPVQWKNVGKNPWGLPEDIHRELFGDVQED
jgi:hypothetical protein